MSATATEPAQYRVEQRRLISDHLKSVLHISVPIPPLLELIAEYAMTFVGVVRSLNLRTAGSNQLPVAMAWMDGGDQLMLVVISNTKSFVRLRPSDGTSVCNALVLAALCICMNRYRYVVLFVWYRYRYR